MPVNNRENEVGALWVKKSERDGSKFFSGKLNVNGEQIDVVVFQNTFKQPGEKSPDWRIYKSLPKEGGYSGGQERKTFERRPAPGRAPSQPDFDGGAAVEDDIPFNRMSNY